MKDFEFVHDIWERKGIKIGASEVPSLIANPEKPTESLTGYEKTPVSVYKEKIGEKERDPAGFAAEMGHYLEIKCIFTFIREVWNPKIAQAWFNKRMQFEMGSDKLNPVEYQYPPIMHNTAYIDSYSVVHPDGVYQAPEQRIEKGLVNTPWGFKVNLNEDFIIEAKSANYFATLRKDSQVRGYDMELCTGQGIPLKHLMQIQFQMMKCGVKTCYLPLIYNTNNFGCWKIKANYKLQKPIDEVVRKFYSCCLRKTPPADMALNMKDINQLYPQKKEDVFYIKDKEEEEVKNLSIAYNKAKKQEKIWKEKAKDAQDALSVYLKDRKELMDFEGNSLCKWTTRKGRKTVMSLKVMQKERPTAYKYLKRNKLIKQAEDNISVKACWKGEDK